MVPQNDSVFWPRNSPNCDKPKSATLQWPFPSISTFSSLRSLKIKDVYNMLVTAVPVSIELPGSVTKIHYNTIWFWADKVCVYKLLMTTDIPHLMQQIRSRKSVATQE
jgi:hypothetical protein